jgi:hypothetical protein
MSCLKQVPRPLTLLAKNFGGAMRGLSCRDFSPRNDIRFTSLAWLEAV